MVGIRIWAVAGLLFFGNCCVFADSSLPPLVTTTGKSEVKVVPDLADMRFDIEIRNPNLKTGLAQQVERMTRLVATLKAAGIEERDLQTSQVIINPIYQPVLTALSRSHAARICLGSGPCRWERATRSGSRAVP